MDTGSIWHDEKAKYNAAPGNPSLWYITDKKAVQVFFRNAGEACRDNDSLKIREKLLYFMSRYVSLFIVKYVVGKG